MGKRFIVEIEEKKSEGPGAGFIMFGILFVSFCYAFGFCR